MKKLYAKSYTDAHTLVSLLQKRGLHVADVDKAEHYIAHIGYYRLSAYLHPLLTLPKTAHRYKVGASFSQAMMLYRFDKKLRMLIFNELEKIEVAVRSAIVNVVAEETGDAFWMTDGRNYANSDKFHRMMDLVNAELSRSKEDFIQHFRKNYSNSYPPAWMLAEILPFGVVTHLFSNLKRKRTKKLIAQRFGLQPSPFESWLTIIYLMRNACGHHARVWNKQYALRPMMPEVLAGRWITLPTDSQRVYFNLCIVKYFLDTISPNNDLKAKLDALFAQFPQIDAAAMGFPLGWAHEPLWT